MFDPPDDSLGVVYKLKSKHHNLIFELYWPQFQVSSFLLKFITSAHTTGGHRGREASSLEFREKS